MWPVIGSLISLVAIALTAVTAVLPAGTIPATLAKMADTERAFARRATEVSVRDAFIEFFADESVSFAPDPGPARERLKQRPVPPPDAPRGKLRWEPRFGDIAASGDLGYLTGPVEQISPTGQTAYANYFSVWKRQAGGEYRVILDVGADQPQPATFADGFVRSPAVGRYKGTDTKAAAEASLFAADQAFGAAIAKNASAAFLSVMHAAGRFHRSGFMSMTSSAEAAAWLRAHVKTMTSEPLKSETAISRDLGYTWGRFTMIALDPKPQPGPQRGSRAGVEAASPKPQAPSPKSRGYYVRVWTRKADGAWQLVADIAEPSRP